MRARTLDSRLSPDKETILGCIDKSVSKSVLESIICDAISALL